jgi:hypothetical protein
MMTEKQKILLDLSEAIAEVCWLDLGIRSIRGRIFRRAEELLGAKITPTPEKIRTIYGPLGKWTREDWRGKRGDHPTPENILETWPALAGEPDPADDRRRYVTGEYAEFIRH